MKITKVLLIVSCISTATPLQAQITNYRHYTAWSRVTVARIWANRWEFSTEYQHRRQNYYKNSFNLLQTPLLHSFRTRIRYSVNKQFTLSLLPFAYFYASPLLGNEKDYQRRPDKEIRMAVQAELKHTFGMVEIFNRYGYENRWIKRDIENKFKPVHRFRYRLLIEKPFISTATKKEIWRPYLSNEVFFNAGKEISIAQVFEHIRVAGGIRWPLHRYVRLDVGYQYARRLRRNGTEADHEHSLATNLVIVL